MANTITINVAPHSLHTFGDLLAQAGVDVATVKDLRTISIGGLGFDYPEDTIRVPDTAENVEVKRDGEVIAVLAVTEDA